jgi:hypothetical protein
MKRLLGPVLMLSAVAQAAEPPAAATPAAAARPTRPLDLRIGDVRKYMTPEEFRANVMGAREEDSNTVVVTANAPLLPMKSEQPIPGGIMAPFWALANPTQAWRLLVPDLKRPPDEKPNPVPPPIFRWGP